jgi:hypothetical protein
MDLGILNTIIALVIVLLVLSLLVQAIQTLIKKLLKMKSRQIEGSLKDLYEQVVGVNPGPAAPNTASQRPSLLSKIWARIKAIFGKSSPGITDTPADVFKEKVLEQFKAIGRKTLFGNAVLDSLSKEDLFKVMGKLESEDFFPDYVAKFQLLCDQIEELRVAIVDTITADPTLRGTASTRIAEVRSILAPIFNNVTAIVEGNQVKPKVLFADLLRLGKLDIRGLLDLLDQAQQSITKEKEAAAAAGNSGQVAALQTLSDEVAKVTKLLGDLSQKFVDAISPLRNKIEQVELWFDTVTQSFDERYARHMRTVAIAISIVVVIMLNANFFQVYKSISTNEVQRNLIIDKGPDLLEQSRKARAAASPSASPVDFKQDIAQTRQDIDTLSSTYQGFGFEPVTGAQFKSFLWGLGGWTIVTHDGGGNPSPWGQVRSTNADGTFLWRAQTPGEWWERRKGNGATLIGWALMVMLLSVGAPFWQDALESLFGIKNLLRQKSGTQNIEEKSGAGQPKE